jgi:DNA polymerase-4
MIACVLVPYFAAAVERQANPVLATKPLVIVDEADRVWAISREAAQAGVRPGMPLRQARTLCPPAALLPANPSQYQAISTDLIDLFTRFSERVEPDRSQTLASLVYVGLTPVNLRDQVEVVTELSQTIRTNTGLEPAIGLTGGKFPAFIAARAIGHNRYLCVTPGQEATFLAPFPVASLPLEAVLARRFRLLGLETLGQLAQLPVGAVLTQFGPPGGQLHKLARGEDDRPVLPYPPPPAEMITRHLDGPVADRPMLAALCQLIAAELATRLEAQGQLARVISLNLELEDGTRWQTRRVLRQPAGSVERLGLNLNLFLEQAQINAGVEAVSVGLADLIPIQARQLELFAGAPQVDHAQRLDDLLPTLIARYGSRFYDVVLTNQPERLPEQRFELRARQ